MAISGMLTLIACLCPLITCFIGNDVNRSLAAASLIIKESRGQIVDLTDDFNPLTPEQRQTIYPPGPLPSKKEGLTAPSMPFLIPPSNFDPLKSKQVLVGNFQLVHKIGKSMKGLPSLAESGEEYSSDMEESAGGSGGKPVILLSGSLDDNEDSLLKSSSSYVGDSSYSPRAGVLSSPLQDLEESTPDSL